LLSAVLAEATEQGTCEYVHDRVLRPLGIEAERWGRDPAGTWDGGHDVYLTARELARFGLMALHDGSWDGEQVAPAGGIEEATSRQIGTGGGWGYGFGWWIHELGGHPTAVAWGFGGQLVYVVPDLDLVAVITTNTHDYGRDYDGSSLMERWVIPAVTDP